MKVQLYENGSARHLIIETDRANYEYVNAFDRLCEKYLFLRATYYLSIQFARASARHSPRNARASCIRDFLYNDAS